MTVAGGVQVSGHCRGAGRMKAGLSPVGGGTSHARTPPRLICTAGSSGAPGPNAGTAPSGGSPKAGAESGAGCGAAGAAGGAAAGGLASRA